MAAKGVELLEEIGAIFFAILGGEFLESAPLARGVFCEANAGSSIMPGV